MNDALFLIDEKYVINRDEHLSTYDGTFTTKKLNLLTKNKGLPKSLHNQVWKTKQQMTLKLIDEFSVDERIRDILKKLKSENYTIACATNSIRETSKVTINQKRIF